MTRPHLIRTYVTLPLPLLAFGGFLVIR